MIRLTHAERGIAKSAADKRAAKNARALFGTKITLGDETSTLEEIAEWLNDADAEIDAQNAEEPDLGLDYWAFGDLWHQLEDADRRFDVPGDEEEPVVGLVADDGSRWLISAVHPRTEWTLEEYEEE